mmetsp:Transcript_3635/g.3937  ORF Transcript_3635/g.3937 Transcript_3635/m.3937 type:complete len:176 (+) Transcript_3635:229-756(+)
MEPVTLSSELLNESAPSLSNKSAPSVLLLSHELIPSLSSPFLIPPSKELLPSKEPADREVSELLLLSSFLIESPTMKALSLALALASVSASSNGHKDINHVKSLEMELATSASASTSESNKIGQSYNQPLESTLALTPLSLQLPQPNESFDWNNNFDQPWAESSSALALAPASHI